MCMRYSILFWILFSYGTASSQSVAVSNDDLTLTVNFRESADSSISFEVSVFNKTKSIVFLCHRSDREYPAYLDVSMGMIRLGLGCEYGFVFDFTEPNDSAFAIQIRAGDKYEFSLPASTSSQQLKRSDLINMQIRISVSYVVSDSSTIFLHPGYVKETFEKLQKKLSLSVQL